MSSPFMQLYIGDYLRDTQGLSTEGHGAYLLILFAMWNADGWVSVEPRKMAQYARMSLARWARVSPDIMPILTVEDGMVTQKRLIRELEKASGKSLKRSHAGKLGAQAKALKNNNVPQANANAIATANAKANVDAMVKHSPETRYQIPEREEEKGNGAFAPSASKPISVSHETSKADDLFDIPEFLDRRPKDIADAPAAVVVEVQFDPVQRAFDAYNEVAQIVNEKFGGHWRQAGELNDSRKRALRARIKDAGGLIGFGDVLRKAGCSSFMHGKNDRRWCPPGLDWILKPTNFTKIMEGAYDDPAGQAIGGRDSAAEGFTRAAAAYSD